MTTTTGETVNVAQPVTATVTQGGEPIAGQPTFVPQQPGYPPQPGQQLLQDYQSTQPGYPPQVQPSYPPQTPYPSQPPGYYPADPYPPVGLKQPVANDANPNSPAQPMVHDASGQPVQADFTQQQNEEFDECACYCCCIL